MSNIVKREQRMPQHGALQDPITGMSVDVFPQNYGPRERGLVMAVCERYGLDPIAREVELLHGQIFITAKGINRIATQDPAFDGIEVEIVTEDWKAGFFVVKASAWRKGCSHPVVEYADSDGSKMRGGAKFRHTITRAKARALRAAFAIPFCSKEELDDRDLPPARSHQQQPTPQPTIEPAHHDAVEAEIVESTASAAPPADGGEHPGQAWKDANRALRGAIAVAGVTDDERKAVLRRYWNVDSSTAVNAKHLVRFADVIGAGPTEKDRHFETQAKAQIEKAGGKDKLEWEQLIQLSDLAQTPWQTIMLERLVSGGEG